MQGVAGNPHGARSPNLAVEVLHVDDECVSCPATDGVAHIGRQRFANQRAAVGGNDAEGAKRLVEDDDFLGSLHDLERHRHADDAGNAGHEAMNRGIVDVFHRCRLLRRPRLH